MNEHQSLSEARRAGFVARRGGNFTISHQYWRWCTDNAKPFVAITLGTPKHKYAHVELDLYSTADVGFSADAGYEILHIILGQPLKPKSTFYVSPTYVDAYVAVSSAKALANFLYSSAIDEGIVFSQEELIERDLKRCEKGEPVKSAFMPFSGDVYLRVLAEMRTHEFWQSVLL